MRKSPSNISPPQWPIQSYVLGGILILLFIAVLRLIGPFFTPLLWAVLLYIFFSPLHRRLVRNLNFDTMKGKILRNVWAGVFTLGTLVIILIPISLVGSIFFRQAAELAQRVHYMASEGQLRIFFERVSALLRDFTAGYIDITADDIMHQITITLANEMNRVVQLGGNIFKNIGGFSIGMLFISFSVFFFYVDGPYLYRLASRAIPIKNEYISALTAKFLDITRNLFFGYIIVALLQSVVAYIVYTIFGVSGSLVFAVLTFFLVFIPMFGATLIWIPLGIIRIAGGDIGSGILFMLVSMVFISGIDNILRPFFLKDRIHLHPLIIFFAILGGIFTLGFNGFILGPVLVIFFMTVLDLFLNEHKIGGQEQNEQSSINNEQ